MPINNPVRPYFGPVATICNYGRENLVNMATKANPQFLVPTNSPITVVVN